MPTSLRKQSGFDIRRQGLAACLLGWAATAFAPAALADDVEQAPAAQAAAGEAFGKLKALEGTWRLADRDGHPLRIVFYPTAGGHGLVEAWNVDGRSHSLTIYHRDGEALLATHYCPQGNQPRMAWVDSPDGSIRFGFRDVTDFDAANEQHQHDLAFEMTDDGRVVRSEHYKDAQGELHPTRLVLERAAD